MIKPKDSTDIRIIQEPELPILGAPVQIIIEDYYSGEIYENFEIYRNAGLTWRDMYSMILDRMQFTNNVEKDYNCELRADDKQDSNYYFCHFELGGHNMYADDLVVKDSDPSDPQIVILCKRWNSGPEE